MASSSDLGLTSDGARLPGESAAVRRRSGNRSISGLWLDGEVLACSCPECRAPMSLRLWLGLADCWRCGTSVQLSEEQILAGQRLLAGRHRREAAQQLPAQPAEPTPDSAATAPLANPPPVLSPPIAPRRTKLPVLPPPRTNAAVPETETRRPLMELIVDDSPGWARWRYLSHGSLASLVVHMLLIIILGLWTITREMPPPPLVFSATITEIPQPGEARPFETAVIAPPVKFESPAIDSRPTSPDVASFEPPAKPFDFGPLPVVPVLPDRAVHAPAPIVSGKVGDVPSNLFAGRDPRTRAAVLQAEGGTTETEAAVARGLAWLAAHQNPDFGHWSLNDFHTAPTCRRQCTSPGNYESNSAATALALLPFLGAGYTHQAGHYQPTVDKGIKLLLATQRPDGDLRGPGHGRMYAHGLAAIALCEAFAMTQDTALRAPAQRALDFIVRSQHSAGGWRYEPREPGDMSVTGWQLMALRSGKLSGLNVPAATLTRALKFVDNTSEKPTEGRYGYMPDDHRASAAMTAEALLCQQYGGWRSTHPVLSSGVAWLINKNPPRPDERDLYYWYYGTQVMHHYGGEPWQRWNAIVSRALVDSQETAGHEAGSWSPRSGFDLPGGRIYVTALAICTLEVYYRHLPLYRQEPKPKSAAKP